MRIVTVRRISQVFFLLLLIWFCIVTTLGVEWWRLRGWPVNWLLQLDPLVAVATMLSTNSLPLQRSPLGFSNCDPNYISGQILL